MDLPDALPDALLDALPETADVRLVVVDMDGTLLDAEGRVPAGLWPLLERMRGRGVAFAPASGRQYATLAAMFPAADGAGPAPGTVFVAENGSLVVQDDEEVSTVVLATDLVHDVVRRMRALSDDGADVGVVVCGRRTAYVERHDRALLDHVDPYYASLTEVPDLLAVDDEAVKVAVFTSGDPTELVEPALAPLRPGHQVVVSGQHWTDVMAAGVHKGLAVRRLQEALGVTRAQTVVFGDYLNDLEMLDEAELSFAMANAHPAVLERARFRAPANTEDGVVRTLTALLGPG